MTHLVDSHLWHLEEFGDSIHDAYTGPAIVLPLSEIQDGHDGSLFVLRWVSRNDLMGSFEVFRGELEGNLHVRCRHPLR